MVSSSKADCDVLAVPFYASIPNACIMPAPQSFMSAFVNRQFEKYRTIFDGKKSTLCAVPVPRAIYWGVVSVSEWGFLPFRTPHRPMRPRRQTDACLLFPIGRSRSIRNPQELYHVGEVAHRFSAQVPILNRHFLRCAPMTPVCLRPPFGSGRVTVAPCHLFRGCVLVYPPVCFLLF